MKHIKQVIFLLLVLTACSKKDVSFIVVSDLHFSNSGTNYQSNKTIIQSMNRLCEEDPSMAGAIRGVVVTGDVTGDGLDSSFERFSSLYGLHGENELKYPVYEGFGNHDGDVDGYVRQQIKKRNLLRKNLHAISENGLHYSWNWENIRLVHLNLYPANAWDSTCGWCKYFKTSFRDAEYSLSFLNQDLQSIRKKTETPVIIFMHYGWDDFSLLWWTEAEQDAFYEVIKDYNVIGIFHGHDHARKAYEWRGIKVFDVGTTVDGEERPGSFMLVTVKDGALTCKNHGANAWIEE